jgi:hypothetical protein
MKKRVFDDNYEDIIDMPHHVSATRRQMTMEERAAQFSPFAALTGHQNAVKETQRLNEERVSLEITKLPIEDI